MKCNVPNARRICDSTNWNATLGNPEKFHELVIARGIQEQLGLLLDSSGDTYWYCLMFNKTLSRSKFGCMRCYCFDVKRERRKNLFCQILFASIKWNSLQRHLSESNCLSHASQLRSTYFQLDTDLEKVTPHLLSISCEKRDQISFHNHVDIHCDTDDVWKKFRCHLDYTKVYSWS